jgi:uncharacterized membrane protein (DUF4010 family)
MDPSLLRLLPFTAITTQMLRPVREAIVMYISGMTPQSAALSEIAIGVTGGMASVGHAVVACVALGALLVGKCPLHSLASGRPGWAAKSTKVLNKVIHKGNQSPQQSS